MTDLVTSAQMRAIERHAIESGAVSGLALMERAGAAVVAAALALRPTLAEGPGHAVVLCGPGNNGGDGFVIARLLHGRGWRVRICLCGDPARLPPDARTMHDRWAALGPVAPLDDPHGGVYGGFGADAPDLIVDAIFGTGLARPVSRDIDQAMIDIEHWRHRHAGGSLIVAVDVPSGLCADSGRVLGTAMRADLTVTFHRAKPGHYLADGPGHCGTALVVADIGLPQAPVAAAARLLGDEARVWLAKHGGHKFRHGHALILAGGPGRTGAARLAARAALRIGAGLVTVGAPEPAMAECAAQLTAIMLQPVGDVGSLLETLQDERINAVCLGPGLGLGAATRDLVLTALARAQGGRRGVVLDADGLTQFGFLSGGPADLFARTAGAGNCVLTPHEGEFGRLFPDLVERLAARPVAGPAYSRLDAVRAAAERAGCVVLLKGADTVIAAPGGAAAVQAAAYGRAAPWLATAGAGDVLAGMIAGLLARGVPAFEAAGTAAWLHVEAARAFGPGLIAEDLPEALPGVLRRVLAGGD